MKHVQSNALQERVLLFKEKEMLFTQILFHGNHFPMCINSLNIAGETYFELHNALTLLKISLNRHGLEIQLGMKTDFEIMKSL